MRILDSAIHKPLQVKQSPLFEGLKNSPLAPLKENLPKGYLIQFLHPTTLKPMFLAHRLEHSSLEISPLEGFTASSGNQMVTYGQKLTVKANSLFALTNIKQRITAYYKAIQTQNGFHIKGPFSDPKLAQSTKF